MRSLVHTVGLNLLAGLYLLSACGGDQTRTMRDQAGGATQADNALQSGMADSNQWPSYGRDYTNRRFSPLTQISPTNVGQLKLAWRYKSGIPHGFEASPVVVDGTMY